MRCVARALPTAAPALGLSAAPAGARGLARLARPFLVRGPTMAPAPSVPLTFFVQRAPGAGVAVVEVAASAPVATLVKAALVELRLDASPDMAELTLSDSGAGAPPLDGTLTLAETIAAGALAPCAKLLVTVRVPAAGISRDDAAPLPYRVAAPDDGYYECEQPAGEMASNADFEALVRGGTLWAVTDKPGGGQIRKMVLNLATARRELAAGRYLLLREEW